jgi:hypothetical protein
MRSNQGAPLMVNTNKKRLLIAACNPYIFYGSWAPLIPELSKEYTMVIVLRDLLNRFLDRDSELTKQLEAWITFGTIEKYYVVPDHLGITDLLRSFKSIMPQLRVFNFDIFMSDAFASVWVKYILADGIPETCKKVVFYGSAPPLTQFDWAGDSGNGTSSGISSPGKQVLNNTFLERIRQAQKRENKTIACLVLNKLKNSVHQGFRKLTYQNAMITDYVLPFLVVGRSFPITKDDKATAIGNNFDAAIFLERTYAEAHIKYFNRPNIYVAQHPGQARCRCHNSQTRRDTLLTVLSTFVGTDSLPDEILATYRRDLQSVIKETGAVEVHLRPHPRESARWPYQLRDYLQASGIHASVVDSTRPMREIACDYIGIVGDVSGALHDARACCDYAFVVAFAGVVNMHALPNPRALLGNDNGIEWIEEDGSYKEGIFRRRLYEPKKHKNVLEILSEL